MSLGDLESSGGRTPSLASPDIRNVEFDRDLVERVGTDLADKIAKPHRFAKRSPWCCPRRALGGAFAPSECPTHHKHNGYHLSAKWESGMPT